jgi:16S rRNA (adenine1518-N6/adenine1519-N6)-dimethyltransferase
MDLTDLSTIKAILKAKNLWAKKFLGQNFLINRSALDKIIETANLTPNDLVIEVGPGLGVLTHELVKKAKKVQSIELDKAMIEVLKENLEAKNLEIFHQDALQFPPPSSPYKVVANIPYNISSPLINHFLQAENRPQSITLLIQKEVAQKICKLNPKMTILSLQVALFGQAKLVKIVPSTSFHPAPKVDSAILHIDLYPQRDPHYTDTKTAQKILKLAKQAFSQGRKKLKNTIGPTLKNPQIDLTRRPGTVTISEWKDLLA